MRVTACIIISTELGRLGQRVAVGVDVAIIILASVTVSVYLRYKYGQCCLVHTSRCSTLHSGGSCVTCQCKEVCTRSL